MKILFMGTSDFAVKCLDSLVKNGMSPSLVISQPDKPKNRGYKLMQTPVKEAAIKYGIEVETPPTIKNKELLTTLERIQPDIIVVVAYGKILPEYLLNFPEKGCINVHGSILPKYRGPAPINFALINNEKKTGITTMYMDSGIDTGDIIFKTEINIEDSDNFETLHARLAQLGGALLVETLKAIDAGNAPRTPQDGESSYTHMIDNTLRKIDFSKTKREIINLIRGLSPVSSAYCFYNGKNLKVYEAREAIGTYDAEVGTVVDNKKLIVKVGDGLLEILKVQPESKNKMSGEDFMRGSKPHILN